MKKPIILLLLLVAGLAACSGSDPETPVVPVIPEPPEPPVPVTTYRVGDLYDKDGVQGIVYLLDDATGTHGMIVSLTEAERPWSIEAVETFANRLDDGKYNCRIIRYLEEWGSKYPAFKWCNDLNAGRFGGWFIPSLFEMDALYRAYNGEGGIGDHTQAVAPCDAAARSRFNQYLTDAGGTPLSEANYWTSSEYGAGFAYPFDFKRGVMDSYSGAKANTCRVRAVRGF